MIQAQDGLKQAWHNGMKWRASHNEHFDILHAQNGAVHMELQQVKVSNRMQIF